MITDTKKGGAGRRHVANYARYMVSAKDHPDAKQDERVLLVQSDDMVSPAVPDPSDSKACRDFAKSIAMKHEQWIKEVRDGKPAPKSWFQSGSISFSEADSKGLTPEKALKITREAVAEVMGADRPVLYAVHGDTDCLHVHFLASSVDSNGRIYAKPYDFREWERSMEKLEIKYELERVVQRRAMANDDPRREIKIKAPSRAELEIAVKNGTPSPKMEALRVLDAAKAEARTMTQFMDAVEANPGYEIVPGSGTEKIAGYKLRCPDGVMIKGSDFGKSYSWPGLVKGGISYEQNRDFEAVDQRRKREAARTFGVHETAGPTLGIDRTEPSPNPSSIGPASAPATPAGIGNGNDPARDSGDTGSRSDDAVERRRVDARADEIGSVRDTQQGPRQHEPLDERASRGSSGNSAENVSSSGADIERGIQLRPGDDQGAKPDAGVRSDLGLGVFRDGNSIGTGRDGHGSLDGRRSSRRHSEGDLSVHDKASTIPATTATTAEVPKHIAKQIEAWSRQVRGLGLTDDDKIRITIHDRDPRRTIKSNGITGTLWPDESKPFAFQTKKDKGEDGENEVFWTVEDVTRQIKSGKLAAWNAKGCDIFITTKPKDHHIILVDDVKDPETLKAAGYRPCLTIETSANNHQCFLRVPKSTEAEDKEAIKKMCREINVRLGDAGAGKPEQPFRLAGFMNKKPGRSNHPVLIKSEHSSYGRVCKTAEEELGGWRHMIREENDEKWQEIEMKAARVDRDLRKIAEHAPDADCRIVAGALSRWTGIFYEKNNGAVDYSVVDYKVAEELLKKGWKQDRLEKALHTMSPGLSDRKGDWSGDYIERTVKAAQESINKAYEKAQARAQELKRQQEAPKAEAPKIVPGLSEQPKPEAPQQRRSYGPSMR